MILTEEVSEYLESVKPEADELLLEMEDYAKEKRIPIASREVSRFETVLARSMNAEKVLEFGTAIAYSSIQLARVGCEVVTLERDPQRIEEAKEYIERAGMSDRIEIIEGEALDSLSDLREEGREFDLTFLDAHKPEYPEYLDGTLPMLDEGDAVVVDNLLWSGDVADNSVEDDVTESIRDFNNYFIDHDQLDSVILPFGDGTGFGVKTTQ